MNQVSFIKPVENRKGRIQSLEGSMGVHKEEGITSSLEMVIYQFQIIGV